MLKNAHTTSDIEAIFRETVGVIDVNASTGSIVVEGAFLTAIRRIRFGHVHGKVVIHGQL